MDANYVRNILDDWGLKGTYKGEAVSDILRQHNKELQQLQQENKELRDGAKSVEFEFNGRKYTLYKAIQELHELKIKKGD